MKKKELVRLYLIFAKDMVQLERAITSGRTGTDRRG
jgi:hypothetical protein